MCGKVLKNPNSPAHINSSFHQEKLKSNAVQKAPTQKEEENFVELKTQLKENLINAEGVIKIAELETIDINSDKIENLVSEFLSEQEYSFRFENLDEVFSIINTLKTLLSFEGALTKLDHFDQEKLKEELRTSFSEIDPNYFVTTDYGFDLVVKLISTYLGRETLIQFLLDFEELEDAISHSYYETSDAPFNPTLMEIERSLSEALKSESQELYNDALAIINTSGIFFEHLKKELLNTFRVNKYIKLKLVGNRTNIYVNDQLFNQCKYLLLDIPQARMRDYTDIDSIDEAAESLDRSMEGHEGMYQGIPPETEFWGHCSNLQAWAENQYDTRILHRNLAFPLLKRLTEVGDPQAKKVFKQELVKRIGSGYSTVIEYLSAGGYFRYLSGPDIDNLLDNVLNSDLEYTGYTPKRELLNRFANMGSQRAKQLLSGLTFEELKMGDIKTIQRILTLNYTRNLDMSKMIEIFPSLKNRILESDDIDTKLSILKSFADYGVTKARPLLRQVIKERVKKSNLTVIQNMFSSGYFKYVGRQELNDLFKDIKIKKQELDLNKLELFKNFANLKVEGADAVLKTGIQDLINTEDLRGVERIVNQNYLKYFTEPELNTLFNSLIPNISQPSQSFEPLGILKKFTDLNTKKAKPLLKKQIKQKIKGASSFEFENLIVQDYLKYLTENEIKTTFSQVKYKKLFKDNFNRAVRLLERLKRAGLQNAEDILKGQIREILYDPHVQTIGQALTKTYLNYFTAEELADIINSEDSKLVEKCFEIALASTTRYNLRNKIIRFLNEIKVASTQSITQKIVNTLKKADLDTFLKFIRAKFITLLTEDEKTILLQDPECLLHQFIVKIYGKEFNVDYNFGLNLSNKGISDLTIVQGLNKLSHLKTLDLRNNQLTKIVGIGNLVNLKKLRIRGNHIPTQLIEHLGGIDRYGTARDPQKFVEYSQRLETGEITTLEVNGSKIEVYGNELIIKQKGIKCIKEIKGLSQVKRLKKLDLSHNRLEDISGIEKLTTLKILNLSHNNLKNLTGIEKLENLEELRLYGNDIQEFKERANLKKLRILDLDTRRKIDDHTFLKYLLQSLSVEDIKQVCRDFDIRGFSRYRRDPLIGFTLNSLSEEEVREVISSLELSIVSKGLDLALKKINYEDREFIESIRVVNEKNNELELKFKGFNWDTTSFLALNPTTFVDPERDCDCRIGANMGLCSHFWIGFIFSLKAGYIKLSDWTLTLLPPEIKNKLKSIKLITATSGGKRLVNEQADNTFVIQNLNSKIMVHDAELSQFEKRQYTWDFKIITYYLNKLKNVRVSTTRNPNEIVELNSLLVRFSENMYLKHNLEMSERVLFTGEIHNDSYLGLMIKNVIVHRTSSGKEDKVKIKKQIPSKKQEEDTFPINFHQISDELSGAWWHHISSATFLFTETPPQIEAYEVQPNDILIHKEILPHDRYPSVRYHAATSNATRPIQNNEVKQILITQLAKYVKNHDRLPSNCRVIKMFKNQSVQINYTPSKSVKFSLKVGKFEGIDDPLSYFKDTPTEVNLMSEEVPQRGRIESNQTEPSVVNQWAIESSSDPSKRYQVTLHPTGSWSCTCPHHLYRKVECKHIRQAKRQQSPQAQRTQIRPAVPVTKCEEEEYLRQIHDIDEIFITDENIFIEFSYPLSKEVLLRYQKKGGFSKRDVIKRIGDGYKKIYEEEEREVGDPGTYDNLYNRRRSQGKYGIWGHTIEDLIIESMQYNPTSKTVHLFIGS